MSMFNKWKNAFKKRKKKGASTDKANASTTSYMLDDADIAHPVKIFIEGGPVHTGILKAGGTPENKTGTFRWYRSVGRQFTCLKDVTGNTYQPTLDDVGSRISTQWIPDDERMVPSAFGEAGPLDLDPNVDIRAKKFLDSDEEETTFIITLGAPGLSEAPSTCTSVHNSSTNVHILEKPTLPNGPPPPSSSLAVPENGDGENVNVEKGTLKISRSELKIMDVSGTVLHSFPLDKNLSVLLPGWGPPVLVLQYRRTTRGDEEKESSDEKEGKQDDVDSKSPNDVKEEKESLAASTESEEGKGKTIASKSINDEETTESSAESGQEEGAQEDTKKVDPSGEEPNDVAAAGEETVEGGKEKESSKVEEEGEKNIDNQKNDGIENGGTKSLDDKQTIAVEQDATAKETHKEEIGKDDGGEKPQLEVETGSMNKDGDKSKDKDAMEAKGEGKEVKRKQKVSFDDSPSDHPVLVVSTDFMTRDVIALIARRLANQEEFQPKEEVPLPSSQKTREQRDDSENKNKSKKELDLTDSKNSLQLGEMEVLDSPTSPTVNVSSPPFKDGGGDDDDDDEGGEQQRNEGEEECGTDQEKNKEQRGGEERKEGGDKEEEDGGEGEGLKPTPIPGIPENELRRVIVRRTPFGMRVSGDLVVEDVGGPAMEAGIVEGDSILSIAGTTAEVMTWTSVFKAAPLPFELVLKKNPNAPPTPAASQAHETPSSKTGGGDDRKKASSHLKLSNTRSPSSVRSEGEGGVSREPSSMEAFLHRQLKETEARLKEREKQLESSLKATQTRLNQFVQANRSYEVEHKRLTEQLKKVTAEKDEAVPRARAAEKAACKEDMDTLREQIRALSKQLAEMNRHEKALTLQVSTEEQKCEALQTSLDEMEEKLNALQEFSDFEIQKLRADLNEVGIELKEAQKAVKKKDEEILDLENHCAHLKAAKDRLESETEEKEHIARQNRFSSAGDQAKIEELETQLKQSREGVTNLESQLGAAEKKLTAMQEKLTQSEQGNQRQLKETEKKMKQQITMLTTQRNRFKRKAESLSHTVKGLMREKAQSANTVSGLYEQKLAALVKEKKAAMQALETYKKAFEQQLMGSKSVKKKVFMASNSRADQELATLRKLANGLSETITDKDEVIIHMRKANKMLGARIQELEKQLKIYEEMAERDQGDRTSETTLDETKSQQDLVSTSPPTPSST